LRAIVIHHSFREVGGADQVNIATIEALREMGFEVTLITIYRPKFDAIEKVLGVDFKFKVDRVRWVLPPYVDVCWPIHLHVVPPLLTLVLCSTLKADLIINTHADFPIPYHFILPYSTLNGAPLISYIHDYDSPGCTFLNRAYPLKYRQSIPWRFYFTSYRLLFGRMLGALERYAFSKSLILTNSSFTKEHITSTYPEVKPIIVRPPVDVKKFSNIMESKRREDRVLIVARINSEKRLETAIQLARLLSNHIKFTIVGTYNASKSSVSYYAQLREMIERYGLEETVEIRTNISLSELLDFMARSKVYFHTKPGEHFGISIVEAMAAGLIPIVPDYGGQLEFVPKQYRYRTLAEAAEIVKRVINIPQNARCEVSNITKQFSRERFKSRMKSIIKYCTE